MEADWELEIGGGAPIIEACWPGFVDLRQFPQRAFDLLEVAQFRALAEALVCLNAPLSPIWTSKCDYWPILKLDVFDPLEFDAPPNCSAHATGCYIDLLPRETQDWLTPEEAVVAGRRICGYLHARPLRSARVDLIVRRAVPAPDREGLGMTAYFTACGDSRSTAGRTLADTLAFFASAFSEDPTLK